MRKNTETCRPHYKSGRSQREIFRVVGASPTMADKFRPKLAHNMTEERSAMNARMIDDATWKFAQEKLLEQWSPEQISGHTAISPETV